MRKQFLASVVLLAASCVAQADVIYNDPIAWLSAISVAPTTVNFEGIAPVGGFTLIGSGAGANTTVGGVNLAIGPTSNGNLFIIGDGRYYPGTAAISSQESTTAFNDLQITLPGVETALGFSFGDFGGDTATITLSDGTIQLPTAIAVPYLGFFGVIAPGGITSVHMTTPDQVLNVSSVSFDNSVIPAPEPTAAVPLLVVLLLAFPLSKRFQREVSA